MKYTCTLIAVRDMECSRRFYCELLGMKVTADFGANVTLSESVSLQTMESWSNFIEKPEGEIILGGNAAELYFEESDMDGFLKKLENNPTIKYVHPPKEHSWGQRVVRFYDPDLHIIEVGEKISAVAGRFYDSGMTPKQIAQMMDVPLTSVEYWLSEIGRL
ncbi:MAG: VOC family protein [Clostridiaceae bacterium]|nr:VOC family protein [Clostridiaceae bacterium]